MYCIHCGVELTEGAARCPLCETPVPGVPAPAPVTTRPARRLRREGWLMVLTAAAALASAIMLVIDLATSPRLDWAGYAIGGLVLAYLWVVVPLWFPRAAASALVTVKYAVSLLYLRALTLTIGADWFTSFACPVTLTLYAFSLAITVAAERFPARGLAIAGGAWTAVGVLMLLLEGLIHHVFGGSGLQWSPYVLACLLPVGVLLLVLDQRPALRQKLEKRMFI
ncbi:MAG: DUF6320 domain-containing protein [Eubacteriales bacterium]|nr:DUF6320 domain-containing protein [Eubacteriales bacterium]